MNDASVEMLTECELSPPVPQVSTSTGASNGTGTMRARMARAAPTTSPTVSPFMRRATSSAWIANQVDATATAAGVTATDSVTWTRQ